MSAEGSDTFEPAAASSRPHPTRVILLVEATAAATSSWRGTRKWLDSILQMMEKDAEQQAAVSADPAAKAGAAVGQSQDIKAGAASPANKHVMPRSQYALIVFATHDRSTPAPIQVSAWTPSLKQLFTWLDGIQFVGGVSSKGTALPHALAEAIALSKSPYPGGSRPPAAAASHPGVMAQSDQEPGAHTHLLVLCPSFNPCRLPLAWPYAADTKASLFSCGHYQAFLERFAAMHADKHDRTTHTLFGQLDFVKGSLAAVTPGAVDIWDLLLSLVRHRLSLSVISSRTQQSRGVLEFFAYANYCLSSLKAACQRGMVVTSSLNVSVYLSPMFTEAQRAFKPIMHKLLQQAKKKAAAQHQQQHAQQVQQGQQQGAGQQQQQQQQQWHAGTAQRPAMGMQQQQQQPSSAAAAAAQQQRQAGLQQQQQQQQQQQARYNSMQAPGGVGQTGMAVQQQPQQQGVPVAVAAGQMPGAVGAQPGPAQAVQQPQQHMTMMVQQHPQMLMQQQQQPQVMPGSFMPQQQAQQQQQHLMQQQQLMQQQPVPMAGVQQQQQQQIAAAAAQKADKQRQPFWQGPFLLQLPEAGIMTPQSLAELELNSSSGVNMVSSWQHRQQVLLQQLVDPAHLKQHLNYSLAQQGLGNKVTRVYYRVVNQGPSWRWLQSQVLARDDKQLILLGHVTPQLKCLVVFGNQTISNRQSQPASNISLADGQIIFSGLGM